MSSDMKDTTKRRWEILVDDKWVESDFGTIKPGDQFRLLDDDESVCSFTGQMTFLAVGYVYERDGFRMVNASTLDLPC